jgi:hypothetical protein
MNKNKRMKTSGFISLFLLLTLVVLPVSVTNLMRVNAQTNNMTNATLGTNATTTDGGINASAPIEIEVPPLVPPLNNETTGAEEEPILPTDNATTEVPPPEAGNESITTAVPTSNVTIVSSNSLIGFDPLTGLNDLTIFGIALNEGPGDSTNTTLMTALFDFNGTIIAANTSTTFPSTILVNQSVPIEVHFTDLDVIGGIFNAAFYQQQADNGTLFFGSFPLPPPPLPPVEELPPVDGGGGGGGIPPVDGGGVIDGGGEEVPPVEEVPPAPQEPPAPVPASLQECLDSYPQNQDICTIGGEIDCNGLIAAGIFDFPVTQGSVDPFRLDADRDGIGCELLEQGAAAAGGPAPPAPIEEVPAAPQEPPANGEQVPPENVTSPELPGGAVVDNNETEAIIPPELVPPPTNATEPTFNATLPMTNATIPTNASQTINDTFAPEQLPSEQVNNTLTDSISAEEEAEDQQQESESQDDQPQSEEDSEEDDNGNDDNNN